jgi:para-nitrobenzyl esterase
MALNRWLGQRSEREMLKNMNRLLLLTAMLFVFGLGQAQTIQTQYGPVTGHANGNVLEFLGIPFASPPLGNLRWKTTVAPATWTTPVLADSFPPKCPQKHFTMGDTASTLEGEEDCLYLNFWSPDTAANLPMMVFIHGGGNQQGSSGEIAAGTELYHGKHLSERGNVVVVTIQYRLGALGYLALQCLLTAGLT